MRLHGVTLLNPRLRRLRIDYERMRDLEARSPYMAIEQATGDPADNYLIHLTCKGIASIAQQRPRYSHSHRLSISLGGSYPREMPLLEMLTPLYHPNISSLGLIDLGGYSLTMTLTDIVVKVIRIIRFEHFNPHSAFQRSAAEWATENQHLFPLERNQIVREDNIDYRHSGGDLDRPTQ